MAGVSQINHHERELFRIRNPKLYAPDFGVRPSPKQSARHRRRVPAATAAWAARHRPARANFIQVCNKTMNKIQVTLPIPILRQYCDQCIRAHQQSDHIGALIAQIQRAVGALARQSARIAGARSGRRRLERTQHGAAERVAIEHAIRFLARGESARSNREAE